MDLKDVIKDDLAERGVLVAADLLRLLGVPDPETVTRFILDMNVDEIAHLYIERYASRKELALVGELSKRPVIIEVE